MNDKSISFSVSPCLFIGLGTNGWGMVDDLRKLLFEEFGVAGLPCFRYLALETNTERVEDNTFLPHAPRDYERVKASYITIPDIAVVASRLDPSLAKEFVPGLAEWLDPNLIKRGNKSYTAGAGFQRQAGRLCLWENWSRNANVSHDLRQVISYLNAGNARDQADNFLRKEYFQKKKPGLVLPQESLVGTSPKIYLLGTLCGGTCSGTFLDIAYFVSDILGVRNRNNLRKLRHPEVIGIFTVPDTLRMTERGHRPNVANCWAALRELDFFSSPESVFKVRFPDGHTIETRDEPFDSVYLVGMANLAKSGFVGEDWKSLTQMCAMNLFTEVVAGMAAKKDEIRINFRAGDAGYLERNQNGNVRAFSAFGLSAIWYPRYRITQAIVGRLGVEMCDGWLGSSTLNATIVGNEAATMWDHMLGRARGSLVGTVAGAHCPTNLQQEIESTFTSHESSFLELGEIALSAYMSGFPPDDAPFADKFTNPDGDYYRKIANAEPLVTRDLRATIREGLGNYLGDHSIAEAKTLVEDLQRRAESLLRASSEELPILHQTIDTSLAADVHGDLSSLLIGRRRQAVREYKLAIWNTLRERVLAHLGAVREHLLRRVIVALREELGLLTGRLTAMETRVSLLRTACENQAREQIAFRHPSNIIPISEQNPDSIEDDVESGTREVLKTTDRLALRALFLAAGLGGPVERLDTHAVKDLMPQLDLAFASLAQGVIANFAIGRHALAHLRAKIGNLVIASQPYIENVPTFQGIVTAQSPNFVFCEDLGSGQEIADLTKTYLTGPGFAPSSSPLDHFIIFYQELPGLAISDLQISSFAAQTLREREAAPDRIATSYQHQSGERIFDIRAAKELDKLKLWLEAAQYLVPEAFQTRGIDRFLSFVGETGLAEPLLINQDDSLREFIDRRGAQPILDRLRDEFRRAGRDAIVKRMNARSENTANVDELRRVSDVHQRLLSDVFA